MMETTITKYIVVRTTWSNAKCSYVRTVKHFDDEAEAIDWAERHSTRDHITCRVFAVECEVKEDGIVCYPCDWSKNALPSVSVENVGTLIYRKQGKDVHDFRESEETCATAEENSANANAEPVMSEWRVSSNGWGEDRSYQVYRRIDVNATDHSGNRENRGGVFDSRAEAQAYADKLNAGIDPEAEEEAVAETAEPMALVFEPEDIYDGHALHHKADGTDSGCAESVITVCCDADLRHERMTADDARTYTVADALCFAKEAMKYGKWGQVNEAPAEPIKASEPVRWYVVLKIAENRKQTKFHFKRRMFYDDVDAITFARSRLRGGCKEAAVYLYDPVSVNEKPATFESDNVQRDAKNIMALLWAFEIYYIDRTAERDLRGNVREAMPDYKFKLTPYKSEQDNDLVKHAQHFDADGTANTALAMITMLCDADIRNTHDVQLNASVMTLKEAEEWYKEATA